MTIEEIKKVLQNGTKGYFATTDGNKLDIRAWQYQYSEGNKFYFTTANTKDVYKQMKAHSQVAFGCASGDYNIRISGEAIFVTDPVEKEKGFSKISESVQKMYGTSTEPTYEFFYIGSGEIKINKGFEPFETVKF